MNTKWSRGDIIGLLMLIVAIITAIYMFLPYFIDIDDDPQYEPTPHPFFDIEPHPPLGPGPTITPSPRLDDTRLGDDGTATIYYYANGGINPPNRFTIEKDERGVIVFYHPDIEPTKEGYRFLGWLFENDSYNFEIDEAEQRIAFSTRRPLEHSTLIYFAQWERIE